MSSLSFTSYYLNSVRIVFGFYIPQNKQNHLHDKWLQYFVMRTVNLNSLIFYMNRRIELRPIMVTCCTHNSEDILSSPFTIKFSEHLRRRVSLRKSIADRDKCIVCIIDIPT